MKVSRVKDSSLRAKNYLSRASITNSILLHLEGDLLRPFLEGHDVIGQNRGRNPLVDR